MESPTRELILDFVDRPPCVYPDCASLELLSVRGCCDWVTDQVIDELGSGGTIKTALLFRCFQISDDAMIKFIRRNGKSLKKLELSGCTHLTDKTLWAISRYCNELLDLDLTRCLGISDIGINKLTELPLESLLLYADAQLGKSAMAALSQFNRLKRLDLCGIPSLDSNNLISMLRSNGHSLEYLNLSWCVNLCDEAIKFVVDKRTLSNIQSLSIFGVRNMSHDEMKSLIDYLKEIKTCCELDIRAIPSAAEFTQNDCEGLRSIMPQLVQWKLHH